MVDRSMDPKLARILYDTSVLPKASTKPPVKPKEFSLSKKGKKLLSFVCLYNVLISCLLVQLFNIVFAHRKSAFILLSKCT